MGKAQQPRRRMRRKPQGAEILGIDRAERIERERRGLGGVIGLDPGVLQPRDIGEIGDLARRLEARDEVGEGLAVVDQHRRRGFSAATKAPAMARKNASPTSRRAIG